MLLAFVDETSDAKFKDYLGLCVATINARSYPLVKKKARKILLDVSWDPNVEFKGSMLFSASNGCTEVEVERRIEAARRLLQLNVGGTNSRLRFHYGRMQSTNQGEDYLAALPGLFGKALGRAPGGAGKNLISVVCDERSDVESSRLHAALDPVLTSKGYVVLESVVQTRSCFDSVGLMFADLVGFLMGRLQTISNDVELFEGLTPEQLAKNGKIKKLKSSSDLIETIKALQVYTHDSVGGRA